MMRLNRLLEAILPENNFYADKLAGVSWPLRSLEELAAWPLTTKHELVQHSPDGSRAANGTFEVDAYARFHQTSGTSGRPMVVLDTAEDWRWWVQGWQYVLDAAEITAADRTLLAFSFGPFIGFWSAHDALVERGALVVPGGGMTTSARLQLLATSRATALFCTPTYALRMVEVARDENIDLRKQRVRNVVVAGEPGGSLPAVRGAIEEAFDASVIDHSGATEVGPWGFGDASGAGLYVNEAEFVAELLRPGTSDRATEGELAELVLTGLGRAGAPILRYRTGDLVRARRPEAGERKFLFLEGGVLGRADDMMVIRGVNIFPSAIEQILREFPGVVEFRLTAARDGAMDQLYIEVEDAANDPQRIADQLNRRLGLRVDVHVAPPGSLPRYEGKSRRFVDNRGR
ncbi:MAG: phenylacetate--CoA ligase family protein [Planctomycetales bacterium]|nr:phenylacetate--CoA ligase family protein [Planctomycetales bacterium]